ncbi:MAG TPA: cob(I)yrinic acid a,c-diamide adenosyltransferase [Nitrosopumilaceae archaeon]|nr:cob(I)yrinic acid a,c-diamide adenosyltransferase [Nitrosopumilaceae archaeon]
MKIYTKTGDDGKTGLQGGKRISKSDYRIKAYGNVDELNSVLGLVLSHKIEQDIEQLLKKIQNELFVLGSDLSNPDMDDNQNRISKEMVENLEKKIDMYENELPSLSNFILPGGSHSASLVHFARTIARRAETNVVSLSKIEKINSQCQIYLNRLSDLLFVIARILNKRSKTPDIIWEPKKDTL